MDRETNIAFIPKAPLTTSDLKRRPASAFFIIALVFFVVSMGITAGIFIYKKVLVNDLKKNNAEIASLRSDYETSAENQEVIRKAEELGIQLNTVKSVLDKHISLVPLFDFLSEHTLKDVQLDSFSFERDAKDGPTVKLSAVAPSYMSAALQRDELRRCTISFQKKNAVPACDLTKDPLMISSFTISTPALTENGNVKFDLTLILNKEALLYRRTLAASSPATTTESDSITQVSAEGDLPLRTQ